ncbi:MAG: SlyX family protein [Beijerinckiaceae bacterium]|nr:SlyX family protein [Beijerinckiaceae bacterium]
MTPHHDALSRRLDTLETRMTHQDQIIEDLNATITAQWRQIDSLVRQVAQFDGRLRDLGTTPAFGQERPPHY